MYACRSGCIEVVDTSTRWQQFFRHVGQQRLHPVCRLEKENVDTVMEKDVSQRSDPSVHAHYQFEQSLQDTQSN